MGLSGSVYHRSHRKVRGLLDQLLGVEISTGVIKTIRSGWHGMVLGPSAAIGAISRKLQLLAIAATLHPSLSSWLASSHVLLACSIQHSFGYYIL